MSEALRTLLRQAPGAGELAGEDVVRGRAEHAVCGDEVEVDVRLAGGVVAELAWRARGCPACMAAAAAAHGALVGAPFAQARARLAERVAALGGLGPTGQHALDLVANALAAARA